MGGNQVWGVGFGASAPRLGSWDLGGVRKKERAREKGDAWTSDCHQLILYQLHSFVQVHLGEGAADLVELQRQEVLAVLLRCSALTLQDHPLHTGTVSVAAASWWQAGLPLISRGGVAEPPASSMHLPHTLRAGDTAGDVVG